MNILTNFPGLSIGIAGGLGPDNIYPKLKKLFQMLVDRNNNRCPIINIDSQSGLRNNKQFDVDKSITFIKNAVSIYNSFYGH